MIARGLWDLQEARRLPSSLWPPVRLGPRPSSVRDLPRIRCTACTLYLTQLPHQMPYTADGYGVAQKLLQSGVPAKLVFPACGPLGLLTMFFHIAAEPRCG